MSRYELRPIGVYDNDTGNTVVPRDGAPWAEYHRWLNDGNVPDPMPPEPVPVPRFDFGGAARARETRIIKRLAETNPVAALLRKAKL